MNKEKLGEAVRLTQEIMQRYHQKDVEMLFPLCAPDIMWIGAQKEQFDFGLEAFRQDIKSVLKEMKPCHMMNQEFHVVQNCGRACTIVGRYMVVSDEDTDIMLAGQQRCVFTWELIEDELKIRHICSMSPLEEWKVKEGEKFVNTFGKATQKYICERIRNLNTNKRITVVDGNASLRFFSPGEIIYAEAERKEILIHTLDEEIYGRMGISEFRKKAGSDFLEIHRGYVVNMTHIVKIQPYKAVMIDGSEIPIPVKRYTAVRTKVAELFA